MVGEWRKQFDADYNNDPKSGDLHLQRFDLFGAEQSILRKGNQDNVGERQIYALSVFASYSCFRIPHFDGSFSMPVRSHFRFN